MSHASMTICDFPDPLPPLVLELFRCSRRRASVLILPPQRIKVCFKLEMMMPFSVALRVLPGAMQATLAAGGGVMEGVAAGSAKQGEGVTGEEAAKAAAAALAVAGAGTGGGVFGQITRALPLIKVGMLMMAYVKLLTVKNGQLEDDVRILKGLKVSLT